MLRVMLLVIGALGALAPSAATDAQVEARPAPPHELARLHVGGGTLQQLHLPAGTPEQFTCDVVLEDGRPAVLELTRTSVWAEGGRVLSYDGHGNLVARTPSPTRTYRGVVQGRPGAEVAASLRPDGLHAVIMLGDERGVTIQPGAAGAAEKDAPGAAHVVFAHEDIGVIEGICGVTGVRPADLEGLRAPRASAAEGGALMVAEVAFDADHEFFMLNGSSVSATEQDIVDVMNAVNLIYERDLNLTHEIVLIVVRNSADDPYAATDAAMRLREFRTEWITNFTDVDRATAHLMTGVNPDGNVIGVAYLGAVCRPLEGDDARGFGLSQSRFTSNLNARTALTAHELGHNWGAGHCNEDSPCNIMCSALGGCSGLGEPNFAFRAIADIGALASSVDCLEPAECAGDLNGDLVVDGADLGILLVAWSPGADSAAGAPADLDGDGAVSGNDLGLLLLAWGLCF